MLLYTTGDSFTYGAELAEDPSTLKCFDNAYREKHAYPTRLAEHLGLDGAVNEGKGGTSNAYIARKAMTFLSQWIADGKSPSDVFVVLGWSMPRRTEFFYHEEEEKKSEVRDTEVGYIQYHPRYWVNPIWPARVKGFFETYNDHFSWSGEGHTRYAMHLLGMQSFLKQRGFPYLFFNTCWKARPEVTESGVIFSLVDPIRFYGLEDTTKTMNYWCTYVAKTKQLGRGHPNEAGHDAWAKLLALHINSNNLLWPSSE